MLYRLIFLTGSLKGQRITVAHEPMTLGRDPQSTVYLPDEEVAAQHAVIEHRGDGLFIRDLGSMNRILHNQHEVREARLRHGDIVEIGRTQFLVQALVQADVRRPPRPRWVLRLARAAIGAAALLALVLAVSFWRRHAAPESSAVPNTSLPVPTNRLAVVPEPATSMPPAAIVESRNGTTGEVPAGPGALLPAVELQDLRADLRDLREAVDQIASQRMAVAATSAPAAGGVGQQGATVPPAVTGVLAGTASGVVTAAVPQPHLTGTAGCRPVLQRWCLRWPPRCCNSF